MMKRFTNVILAALAIATATPVAAQDTLLEWGLANPHLFIQPDNGFPYRAPQTLPGLFPEADGVDLILGLTNPDTHALTPVRLDGAWMLHMVEMGDRGLTAAPAHIAAQHPVAITRTGQIRSYFGCNHGSGQIEIGHDGRVERAGIGMTLMACFSGDSFDEVSVGQRLEEAVADAFYRAERVEVTAEQLWLRDADDRILATFWRL